MLDQADGIGASFFEVTTAATFLAFAREPADACVVEVGLGGRLDATNVLADPAVAERRTGYVVGGISPVGQRTALATVVDASAASFETVFVSGGRRGFDIEIAPADLVRATGAQLLPVARD